MFMEASLSKAGYQEIAASLFQPDPLIVDQHSDTFRRNPCLQPRLAFRRYEDLAMSSPPSFAGKAPRNPFILRRRLNLAGVR